MAVPAPEGTIQVLHDCLMALNPSECIGATGKGSLSPDDMEWVNQAHAAALRLGARCPEPGFVEVPDLERAAGRGLLRKMQPVRHQGLGGDPGSAFELIRAALRAPVVGDVLSVGKREQK